MNERDFLSTRYWLAIIAALFIVACGSRYSTDEEAASISEAVSAPPITPQKASIPANVEQQFHSVPSASWSVADPTIASVSTTGLVTALKPGTTTVFASGLKATLTVTTAKLTAVRVSEASRIVTKGRGPVTFVATGRFSDGTQFALRAATTSWTSSNVAIATIAQTGIVTSLAPGTVVFTATDQVTGLSGSARFVVTGEPVTSVSVAPTQLSIPVGALGTFKATAFFSRGVVDKHSDIVWSVSDPAVASVSDSGEVTGLAVGRVTVFAMDIASGIVGTAALTVISDRTVEVQVTCGGRSTCTVPADQHITVGATATAITSGSKRSPLSWTPTWTSSNTAVATVTSTGQPTCIPRQLKTGGRCSNTEPGQITGVSPGTAIITATDPISGFTGSVQVKVQPVTLSALSITPKLPRGATGPSIPVGVDVSYSATATFRVTGATATFKADVTSQVAWSSSDKKVAIISNAPGSAGVATTMGKGKATISAVLDGRTATAALTVTTGVLKAIAVSPQTATLPNGATQQLEAMATYSVVGARNAKTLVTYNVTDTVAWTSSSPAVAISNSSGSSGLATAMAPGTAVLTATDGSTGISGAGWLTVTPASLVSLAVSPPSPSVGIGLTQEFHATGTFSDGSHRDLTDTVLWTSTAKSVATISNAAGSVGIATAVAPGSASIGAFDPTTGIVAVDATFVVTAATLTSLAITPASATIADGFTQQFTAMGTFSDRSVHDLTAVVTWSVVSGTATVSNAAGDSGLVTSAGPGTSTLQAVDPTIGLAQTATLTVTAATLTSIAITPSSPTVPKGTARAFVATGAFSDGSHQNLTGSVTWSSSQPGVFTISNDSESPGVGLAMTAGYVTVSATDPATGVTGTASVTVTGAVLVSISVTPPIATVPRSTTRQFTAVGVYSDNTTWDLTRAVTWSTSSPSATISNASGSNGLATAQSLGTTTLTALDPATGIQGTATMTTVMSAPLVAIQIAPTALILNVGQTAQLTATGVYGDGSSLDLTSTLTWTSSASTASVSNAASTVGVVTALTVGTATITATDPMTTLAANVPVTVTQVLPQPGCSTLYGDGFEQPSGWGMFEEIVGNNDACYASGIGQVVQSTDVSALGSNSLRVWANQANSNYSNHVIGQKKLLIEGRAGIFSYSVRAYISPATANTGQTGPEISMQNTRSPSTGVYLTSSAGVQYQSNPYILNDAGAPADAWALWVQTAPGLAAWKVFTDQALQAGQWYTLTLVADYTANAYRSFAITGPGISRQFDLTMYQIASESKGFTEEAFWITLEGENLYNNCSATEGPASTQELTPTQNIVYYDDAQLANCGVQILATMPGINQDVAVDATSVYFTNANTNTVSKVPVSGGPVTTLASGAAAFGAYAIAVDATSVYWTTHNGGGTVMKVSVDGTGLTTLATGQSYPQDIAVDATNVYWLNIGDGTVMQAPLNGGPLTTLATGQNTPYRIALSTSNVYWTNFAQTADVMYAPIGSGEINTLVFQQNTPLGIATDGTHVYWTSFSGGTISSAPLGGDSVTTLASGQIFPYDMVTDGINLYWTTKFNPGTVAKVPVGGGPVTTIASGLSSPSNLTIDGTSVYWVSESDGNVMKAPK